MKKKIYCFVLLALILLLPFSVSAKDGVVITKVERLAGSSEDVAPTVDGLTVTLHDKLYAVGSKVTYEITFENKDSEEYKFADYKEGGTGFPSIDYSNNEYVSTSLYCEEGYTIKANSTHKCNITIAYIKDVPESALSNGKFVSNNKIDIKVGDKAALAKLNNPTTSSNIIIVSLIVLVVISSLIVISRKNKKVGTIASLIVLAVIPVSVFAANLLSFKVNSNVEIIPIGEFCYYDGDSYTTHQYRYGMGWEEYMNSSYNTENFFVYPQNPTTGWGSSTSDKVINAYGPPQNYQGSGSFVYNIDTEKDKIKPASEVCYFESVTTQQEI